MKNRSASPNSCQAACLRSKIIRLLSDSLRRARILQAGVSLLILSWLPLLVVGALDYVHIVEAGNAMGLGLLGVLGQALSIPVILVGIVHFLFLILRPNAGEHPTSSANHTQSSEQTSPDDLPPIDLVDHKELSIVTHEERSKIESEYLKSRALNGLSG